MTTPKSVIVLGATGSVGRTAAAVIEEHPGRFVVEGLVAHRRGADLWEMAQRLHPRWIGLTDQAAGQKLRQQVNGGAPRIVVGEADVLAALKGSPRSLVIAAMSGFSGLVPALTVLEQGMPLLLANKETLVAAGDLVRSAALRSGAPIIPVDSEHSAVFQCLALPQPVRRVILTCSGGPFRGWPRDKLADVTVEQALRHPNWVMGPKITVDSATLMNKGLELIEAHHLFNLPYGQIDVVVHPESVIHSLVEFVDGATLAQMGWPDMRVPVQVALSWPDRWPLSVPALELGGRTLTFEAPDVDTFPALTLARRAGEAGGILPTVLNAANEAAVAAFLQHRLPFLGITEVVEDVLAAVGDNPAVDTLDAVLAADRFGRRQADLVIARRGGSA